MKKISVVLALALLLSYPVMAADPFSIRTSLGYPQNFMPITIPARSGEVLEFSSADLELRLGISPGTLEGLTLTALPNPSAGMILLDSVEAEPYDYLTRVQVDRLCFRPADGASSAVVTFIPRCGSAITASLHIRITDSDSTPPEIENLSLETYKNIPVSGFIPVTDYEEEGVTIRVVQAPKKGQVRFSGQSFVYGPFQGSTGRDIFTVLACDSAGNLSREAVISISIGNNREAFSYTDMNGHPSHFAAIKLREHGIMSGRQIGSTWLFAPSDQMSRGDFLVLAITAAGIRVSPAVNTGLPNDASIPMWLKPYVKAGIEAGMISPSNSFSHRDAPTRAEAVLMTDRAGAIRDVKDYSLSMHDASSIPEWAVTSYKNLAAYKMLDLYEAKARPNSPLTNSYAADLVWQLYRHSS